MDRKPVSVKSYANIAIIKYWGKENSEAMVPSTSSISLSLGKICIRRLDLVLWGLKPSPMPSLLMGSSRMKRSRPRLEQSSTVLNQKGRQAFVRVDTSNNMPTAAGLSSSSSGLSALVKACNRYYQLGMTQAEQAQAAKFASGSSSRSFFGPLAAWDKDTGEIYQVETDLKLAMIMLVLNDQQKNSF